MTTAAQALPEGADGIRSPEILSGDARFARFGEAIDAIRKRVEAEIGEADLAHVKKMRRFSQAMEVTGRVLIHASFEPVGFLAGVVALWLHKQVEATEIGHTALHGAYDDLPGADAFRSKGFDWKVPIDEESWKVGHNQRHHGATNVAGKDPDIHFGPVRLNAHTPHNPVHYAQLPFMLGVLAPNFAFLMNLHFTGLSDVLADNGRPERFDFIERRDWKTAKSALRKALRKYGPYYGKEFVFFPLLAGPFFWKVLLGNWRTEVMRDVYSAATIYCGHVGEDVRDYPAGTQARGKGRWYAMQVEAANNFEVPLPVSILCGALDRQIEHHLFPKFPTNRLREIA
ncbi:MAG: fatty acid desaturase, partial [Candidatus Methylomirabilis sp.]|nr:fatty acid desaturase [Deltaproteobacteria bacterium]